MVFEHLKRPDLTPVRRYAKMVTPISRPPSASPSPTRPTPRRAIPTVRERARTLREAADAMDYFFRAPAFDEKAKKKFLTPENAGKLAELKCDPSAPRHVGREHASRRPSRRGSLPRTSRSRTSRSRRASRSPAAPSARALRGARRPRQGARASPDSTAASSCVARERIALCWFLASLLARGSDARRRPASRSRACWERPTSAPCCRFRSSSPSRPSSGSSSARRGAISTSRRRSIAASCSGREEFDFRPAVMLVMAAIVLTHAGLLRRAQHLRRPHPAVAHELRASCTRARASSSRKYDELYSYGVVGLCARRRLRAHPLPGLQAHFPARQAPRHGASHARIHHPRLDLFSLPFDRVAGALARRRASPISAATTRFTRGLRAAGSICCCGRRSTSASSSALELFFRGLWLGALRRSLGSGAIFAMCVPYCMIHFGKPYLEANGAIIAGIVLGSLRCGPRASTRAFWCTSPSR